jgi:glutamate/tyrosine decarboxylase-like PLP-dependent enzyme
MDKQFDELVRYVISFVERSILNKNNDKTILRQKTTPEKLMDKLPLTLQKDKLSSIQIIDILEQIIENSVITNHPYFMNQMFGKTRPISFIADILIAVLNTSMYTFEVAPVFSLIEKEVITKLGAKIWGTGIGDGVFTAGGSISNMNALFLARQHHLEHAKQNGLFNEKPLAVFVSEQAHYSFTKGVNFLGFGLESLIKIKSKKNAQIDIKELKKAILKSKEKGKTPLMLIGIAGTTISGSYDDIESLAQIAKENKMWFHVDAAYGGSLLFSERQKHHLKGIEHADSVSWNFHKIMGMSLSTSSFLTREKGLLNKAFSVDAGYLFHEDTYDYDLGQKSLRGGRRPDAFKLWLTWKYQGETGLTTHIEKLCNAADTMAALIQKNPKIELFTQPESTIVCFRYTDKITDINILNQLNIKIRNTIFDEGKMIFNYARLNNAVYLRCVLLDPEFTPEQLQTIIDKVVQTGNILLTDTEI